MCTIFFYFFTIFFVFCTHDLAWIFNKSIFSPCLFFCLSYTQVIIYMEHFHFLSKHISQSGRIQEKFQICFFSNDEIFGLMMQKNILGFKFHALPLSSQELWWRKRRRECFSELNTMLLILLWSLPSLHSKIFKTFFSRKTFLLLNICVVEFFSNLNWVLKKKENCYHHLSAHIMDQVDKHI